MNYSMTWSDIKPSVPARRKTPMIPHTRHRYRFRLLSLARRQLNIIRVIYLYLIQIFSGANYGILYLCR